MKIIFPVLPAIVITSVCIAGSCADPVNVQKQSDTTVNGIDSTIQQDSMNIIAPGAKLQLVSNQFSFTEGPAANKNGDVYFTDQPNNKIWKYSTEGELSVFLDKAGRSN